MTIDAKELRIKELEDAIREHRRQKADDRCIEDDDKLYSILRDGVKCDRNVGSKFEMARNCLRFIENRCQEGGLWKSYVELEKENREMRAAGRLVINELRLSQNYSNYKTPSEMKKEIEKVFGDPSTEDDDQ